LDFRKDQRYFFFPSIPSGFCRSFQLLSLFPRQVHLPIPFTKDHLLRTRPFGRSNVRIIPIVASASATVPTNRGWTPVDPVGPGQPQLNPPPIFSQFFFFSLSLLHFYFRLNRLRSWTAGDPLVFQRSRSLFGLHSSAILNTLRRKQLKI
jgi:hypothetical protein